MKSITLLLFLFHSIAFSATPPKGFTSIFNGKNLDGWWGLKTEDPKKWLALSKSKFKDKLPKVLYGGSVNSQNITILREINNIDGFLIGGASQNAKKFIDIVKKTYS